MTVDLSTTYLGLRLRSPIVASASPVTGRLDSLRRLEAAGVAAVVMPSLFEEQLVADAEALDRALATGAESSPEAAGYFPPLAAGLTGPDRHLARVELAKRAVEVPVIASVNGVTPRTLARHALLLESAGADAIELNLYLVASDPRHDGRRLEERYCELVAAVRAAVRVPLAVKISPFFTALAHAANQLVAAGADGLVLFNRFHQPDIDIEQRSVSPELHLSVPSELLLPLRWIGILAGQVDASLAATTGVHGSADVIKVLLAGADVAMMASALLRNGPDHIRFVEEGVRFWLDEHDYPSVNSLQGSVSRRSVPDPEAFDRAAYVRMLLSHPG